MTRHLHQFDITATNGSTITVVSRYIARACRWAARYLRARNLTVWIDGEIHGRYHVNRKGKVTRRSTRT